MPHDDQRVVIIGGGFGGLAAARELGKRNIPTTIIDKRNYHLFQPLLYQVATAALSPGDIAAPIRRIVRKYASVDVIMGEVEAVDTRSRDIRLLDRAIGYDKLILATGATHSYFGHDEWARFAPGLKTLEDATDLRARLLSAFETAESSTDPAEQSRLLTFVVIGGGPTGVELAGAIAELSRRTLVREFRHIDPRQAHVLLVEAGDRLLPGFHPKSAAYAARTLKKLGVDIRLNAAAREITSDAVQVGDGRVATATVVWAAGVQAVTLAHDIEVKPAKAGRLPVEANLALKDHPDIFVVGDLAYFETGEGEALPGLAQVAKQQGQHLGRSLAAHLLNGTPLAAFSYRSRGNAAIIGRNAAVFEFGKHTLRGRLAWMLWAIVHVYLLVGFENRLLVAIQWLWLYLTSERSARLVTTYGETGRRARVGDANE